MDDSSLYGPGARRLQDAFDSRRIADRLEDVILQDQISASQRAFIESLPMFFLATVDGQGRPDVSYKGGLPGFVRVIGPSELAFPSYDGNGMFKSLGAILENPAVGLLFIGLEQPKRLRVLGRASIDQADPLIATFHGAQLVVRVQAERIFDNCPRYIHEIEIRAYSRFVPRPETVPPIPGWKRDAAFRDALPGRDLADLAKEDGPDET